MLPLLRPPIACWLPVSEGLELESDTCAASCVYRFVRSCRLYPAVSEDWKRLQSSPLQQSGIPAWINMDICSSSVCYEIWHCGLPTVMYRREPVPAGRPQ